MKQNKNKKPSDSYPVSFLLSVFAMSCSKLQKGTQKFLVFVLDLQSSPLLRLAQSHKYTAPNISSGLPGMRLSP